MTRRGRPPKEPARQVPDWARRIREARESLGMSQEELGDRIGGKRQSSVTDYESGKSEPDLATFDAIASTLGVGAVWLVYGKPDNGDPVGVAGVERHKNDRLFVWTFHQAARLLAEEGLEGDLAYLGRYARKLMNAAEGAPDDTEAKERIRTAIDIERSEIRQGLDQIRKNRI